eukprot:TRINITY_DN12778_c0_g1_i1.p1 TRINITY_DN12778_c0_g1~~TRINITY_DN12778_c0_g1_i1.p1  ORF type:complete len:364 (+),score=25.91 TRINITY_DN12778_c0_g1_i1:141-1232(+)
MNSLITTSSKKESKKPKYSRFTQQELPACKPLLTPAWVIGGLFLVGAVFIPIGVVALMASNSVVEVVQRYDNQCIPASADPVTYIQSQATSKNCSLAIKVTKRMDPPVYVYYQLTKFYQNHRRYVKSRSDSQLRGVNISSSDFETCQPEAYLWDNQAYPIRPCGLIAWSQFNDSFSLSNTAMQALPIDSSNIAWPSDQNGKFAGVPPTNFNTEPALRGGASLPPNQLLNQSEHLMVWMRTAALPTFRKLYGSIDTAIEAGTTLRLDLLNQYNSYEYGGEKAFVLSTASWLGGANQFLGIAYLVVGGLCFALGIVFFVLLFAYPRPLGDTSYLSWNRHAMAAAPAASTASATSAAAFDAAADGN